MVYSLRQVWRSRLVLHALAVFRGDDSAACDLWSASHLTEDGRP
jgi:hypothetical protein